MRAIGKFETTARILIC